VSAPSRPRRKTRAEKKADTRRRLLDAAAAVFVRRGFEAASVEEITAEAGFTRGAFYSNFTSKEQLLVEMLQQRVYDEYRRMLERSPADASPVERLRWGAHALMERYEKGEEEEANVLFILWLECLAHAARRPEFKSLAATFWSGTRTAMAIEIGEAFQQVDGIPPVEPKELAIALTALDIGLAVQHLVDPEDVPLSLYPKLYELLFAPIFMVEPDAGKQRRR
jgi:AcrR family transcriptional regulator